MIRNSGFAVPPRCYGLINALGVLKVLGGVADSLFGTKLTVVASAGVEELNFRSLERICRAQAALTTHEPTKRRLERMAEEYRRLADFQDRQQAQE